MIGNNVIRSSADITFCHNVLGYIYSFVHQSSSTQFSWRKTIQQKQHSLVNRESALNDPSLQAYTQQLCGPALARLAVPISSAFIIKHRKHKSVWEKYSILKLIAWVIRRQQLLWQGRKIVYTHTHIWIQHRITIRHLYNAWLGCHTSSPFLWSRGKSTGCVVVLFCSYELF